MVDAGMVITVGGPISPSALGVTDAHDHLFMNSAGMPNDAFSDLDRGVEELSQGVASGLATIVELTPIGLGRQPALMRELATRTGAHIVAATGFHRDSHYPRGHWVYDATDDVLVGRMVMDLKLGMHPSDWDDASLPLDQARAGVIKGGASYQLASDAELRRLHAIARASLATGAPIVIHTEVGTWGHEIVDLLTGDGVAAERVTLAHMDRNPDAELHAELLARGINLVYDTIGRIKYGPESQRIDLIEAALAAGHGDRVMLGLDLGKREYLRSYGGAPGLRHLMDSFVPRVRRRVGEEATDKLLVANPARVFAFGLVAGSSAA